MKEGVIYTICTILLIAILGCTYAMQAQDCKEACEKEYERGWRVASDRVYKMMQESFNKSMSASDKSTRAFENRDTKTFKIYSDSFTIYKAQAEAYADAWENIIKNREK